MRLVQPAFPCVWADPGPAGMQPWDLGFDLAESELSRLWTEGLGIHLYFKIQAYDPLMDGGIMLLCCDQCLQYEIDCRESRTYWDV